LPFFPPLPLPPPPPPWPNMLLMKPRNILKMLPMVRFDLLPWRTSPDPAPSISYTSAKTVCWSAGSRFTILLASAVPDIRLTVITRAENTNKVFGFMVEPFFLLR
jgi:hypothetical protein